jgi:hypothetical protein
LLFAFHTTKINTLQYDNKNFLRNEGKLLVKVSETTRKRQSAFYVTAITYILVYAFSVSITGVQEVGLKVNLPKEFTPSLLFVTSVFIGLRYFVELWGDANFFQWIDVEDNKLVISITGLSNVATC